MNQSWNVRAHGRKLALGLALSGLTVVVAQGGCASSDTPEFILLPDAGNGSGNSATGGSSSSSSGGSVGSGGSNSTGGSFGTGGSSATGGAIGTGGTIGSGGSGSGGTRATGGSTGSGGMTGSGGTRASGGSTGSGGMTASGGSTGSGGTRATGGTTGTGGSKATGGTSGSGGSGGTAPTFTQIYQQILTVSCAGSQCHNPGSQSGVSFSSQSTAYNSVKSRVTAGNATGSSFYSTVNSGKMPPGGKLPASQLQMIADWINAGAMNN